MPRTESVKKSFYIAINQEWCKGCNICILICPKKVFELSQTPNQTGYFTVRAVKTENCIGCLECELHCPDLAIIVMKLKDSKNN